ncbi:hypothetical protein [Shewanella algae]|uniref:hypothetical protein n=1 Tax=Shewanella algae TaxID=38313 RepID=UPI00399BA15A
MSLHFNGTEIKEVYFNGTKLTQVNFNGAKVWPSAFVVTGSNWSGSSSSLSTSTVTGSVVTTAVKSIECFAEMGGVSVLNFNFAASFGPAKNFKLTVQAEGVAAYGEALTATAGYWIANCVGGSGLLSYLYANRAKKINFSFAPV